MTVFAKKKKKIRVRFAIRRINKGEMERARFVSYVIIFFLNLIGIEYKLMWNKQISSLNFNHVIFFYTHLRDYLRKCLKKKSARNIFSNFYKAYKTFLTFI